MSEKIKPFNCTRDFVTLIIKVVDFCNFECDFCRYYLNQNRKKTSMNIETFKESVIKACEYNISRNSNHLTIIFHGGEPMLWGIDNFKKAIEFEKEFEQTHKGFKFINDIQTNGSLINENWINFFNDNNFSIGISIDGPEVINYHKSKKISTDKVLNNIKLLNENKCKYGILSVITNKHAEYADEYYNFLVDNDIHSVGFCYCFDPKEKDIVSNENLTSFLTKMFNNYFFGDYRLHIREFEFVMKLSLGLRVEGCTFSFHKSCGNYFSVSPNGDVHFCDSYDINDVPLCSIKNCDFFDIKNLDSFKNIISACLTSGESFCNNCNIKTICGGGCARHVLSNGKHAFCDTFRILYPYIQNVVKESGVKR